MNALFLNSAENGCICKKVTLLSVVWFIRLVNWKRVLFPGRFCNRGGGGHGVTLVSRHICLFNTAGRHKVVSYRSQKVVFLFCAPQETTHTLTGFVGRGGGEGSIFSCVFFSYMLTSQSSGPAVLWVAPPPPLCYNKPHILYTATFKTTPLRKYAACVCTCVRIVLVNTINLTLWMGMERIRVCTQKWE